MAVEMNTRAIRCINSLLRGSMNPLNASGNAWAAPWKATMTARARTAGAESLDGAGAGVDQLEHTQVGDPVRDRHIALREGRLEPIRVVRRLIRPGRRHDAADDSDGKEHTERDHSLPIHLAPLWSFHHRGLLADTLVSIHNFVNRLSMAELRKAEAERLLEFAGDAHSVDGPEAFTTELLDRLGEAMKSEFVTYMEFDAESPAAPPLVTVLSSRQEHYVAPRWPHRPPHVPQFALRPLGHVDLLVRRF